MISICTYIIYYGLNQLPSNARIPLHYIDPQALTLSLFRDKEFCHALEIKASYVICTCERHEACICSTIIHSNSFSQEK